ncbi:TonB-dependent receptor [Rhodobacteraceae bacterium MYP1-1]|uniref:TonB-dependent receptor n=2 Tax=Halocynthiibacter styelae TaxID=2761955 RepID=A0A8J7IKW2_9RHOB|nr:TonB-dependent receptor [Paenihalocynthiibacter styelae]
MKVQKPALAALLGATAFFLPAQVALSDGNSPATVAGAPEGFIISINGETLTGDDRVRDDIRRTDVQLAQADVQVVYDGLGGTPRLDLQLMGGPRIYRAGDEVTVQSELNYPAYVERAEIRVVDLTARGGAQVIGVIPVEPNGQARVTVPEGENIALIHRVYDARGRFDATAPIPLSRPDRRAEADGVEEGSDQTALRRIPVYGGAVTVSGSGVPAGASVSALGERIRPDASGGFVVQRILPAGDYPVNVQVRGAGQNVDLTRDVDIPVSEWFYVAVADLTVGGHRDGLSGARTTYRDGRLAGYVDGRTENGVQITASLDTGHGDLKDIFRRLQDKDPRQLAQRVDPRDLYPTYGDDSTSVDNTPTSGRVYLRIEREGNYIQFGDFDANLDGNTLVSNSRALYGAQAAYATPQTTDAGEARARFTAYAAQPDQLAQRDVFLGTGGTVYFLERQDIQSGTARLFAQVRDADTGRIIKTVELQPGTDFTINNIQGIVTLTRPLSGSVDSGLIIQGSDPELVLVAQYEYTPTLTNIDGFAFGGRGEVWATDQLRFGANAMVDESGSTDHKAIGVDVLWRLNDDTYLSAEIARTEGTGFTSTFSNDGGLIVNSDTLATGSGEAVKLDGRVSLADLGYNVEGSVGGYFEHRREGFSNLDYQVLSTTGDETLWGVYADIAPRENLKYAFYADSYENDAGKVDRTFGAETRFALNDRTELGLGVEYVDLNTASDKGTRTDIAARLEHSVSEDLDVYAFGQSSVSVNGLERADRYGVGTVYRVGDNWTLSGEISDGTEGAGGRLTGEYDDGAGNTTYLGYELDAGREVDGNTLIGRDKGRFVVGGTREVSSNTDIFFENAYDAFGRYQSVASAFGLTYTPSDIWSSTITVELGTVDDDDGNDFDRKALSFGLRRETEDLTLSGRLEYRVDEGLRSGNPLDTETFVVAANANYTINPDQRLVFAFNATDTNTNNNVALDGEFAELSFGYAYRPVNNDRLNLLARYRYVRDMYGQRVDDADEDGPRQRSHVFSIDASYDLDEQWTLGGKFGYRRSETAANETAAFAQNDAVLSAVNLRYHRVHNWDVLLEVRNFRTIQGGTDETAALAAAYRHFGNNVKLGLGYNFGSFSDDLTDLIHDDEGVFLNLVAKF